MRGDRAAPPRRIGLAPGRDRPSVSRLTLTGRLSRPNAVSLIFRARFASDSASVNWATSVRNVARSSSTSAVLGSSLPNRSTSLRASRSSRSASTKSPRSCASDPARACSRQSPSWAIARGCKATTITTTIPEPIRGYGIGLASATGSTGTLALDTCLEQSRRRRVPAYRRNRCGFNCFWIRAVPATVGAAVAPSPQEVGREDLRIP